MPHIFIHEVGLRDGLQVEKAIVPLEEKIRWTEGLFESGVDIIQLGSFVHQEKVPQMADTDALFRRFANNKPAHVTLSGLVLNEKGLERGLDCGVEMFCMGVSASETHDQKNTADHNRSLKHHPNGEHGVRQERFRASFSLRSDGFEGPIRRRGA
jgi:hydroxymethylglutaryl-CoA lyase